MDFKTMMQYRELLVQLVETKGFKNRHLSTDKITFKCPHCGDEQSKKRLGRGNIRFSEMNPGDWYISYSCFNGGCPYNNSVSIKKYLNDYHPEVFNQLNPKNKNNVAFQFKLVSGKVGGGKESAIDWEQKEREYKERVERELKERMEADKAEMRWFIPIMEQSSLKNTAIRYLKNRKIPERVWKNFFVCTRGKYENRIIIPYLRKGKKPSYFQARGLYKFVSPTYLNRVGPKQVYNLDFVDPEQPVVGFEGLFDAVFMENSIALGGVAVNSGELAHLKKLCLVYDNDHAGRVASDKMLAEGYPVLDWKPLFEEYGFPMINNIKDWNDLVLETGKVEWSFQDIKNFFRIPKRGNQ